jgi:hypothetical protein
MGIKQLNASYVRTEDRILLRVTTEAREEFRFWLTRPVAGDLLTALRVTTMRPLVQKFKPRIAQTIAAFEQEAVHSQTRLDDKFVPGDTLPLGEAPRLIVKLEVTEKADDLQLQLTLANGPGITLRLTGQLAQQFGMLVASAQKRASWGLSHRDATHSPTAGKTGDGGAPAGLQGNKTIH